MSKFTEYLASAIGYAADGYPASIVQFTFGNMPFFRAETETIEKTMQISSIVQSEAIVDLKVVDDLVQVSFDFSADTETFLDFSKELDLYNAQRERAMETLNSMITEYKAFEDDDMNVRKTELYNKIRGTLVPFMLPTILPLCYHGTVHVGFANDPKFVFYTSDEINRHPNKVTMIFAADDLFCQDEFNVYVEDENEIDDMQEAAYLEEEAKRLEREAYRSQYGYTNDDEEDDVDNKLKGVRFK